MVGFNYVITFNNNGKITDYQKDYNKETSKIVNAFLPLNYNNKKNYKAVMSVAVANTYPTQVLKVEGYKSESDLNKYIFDLTQLYNSTKKKYGLCRIELFLDNGRTKFKSESFRIH